MTIHRSHPQTHFCVLPNELLQDKSLSFRARGILAMMLSMPSEWQTYQSWISEQAPEGDDAVRTAIRELEAAGYLTKKQRREGGRMAGFQWDWYSHPLPVSERTRYRRGSKITGMGKSGSGESDDGKTGTRKNSVKKGTNVQTTQSEEPEETPSKAGALSSSISATWMPSNLTKAEQLARLKNRPAYPTQDSFEQWLSDLELDGIINYRPDLYAHLCRNKWHQWNERLNKWVPIRDIARYARALNEHILASGR